MRLRQAIRQFNLEAEEIVKRLQKHGIEISDHPNSKLDEKAVQLLSEELEAGSTEREDAVETKQTATHWLSFQ